MTIPQAALHAGRRPHVGLDAHFLEVMCQLIGPGIELRRAQLTLFEHHRKPLQGCARTCSSQLVDALVPRKLGPGVVSLHLDPMPLGLDQQRQILHPLLRVDHDCFEQSLEVPHHPLDRRAVERFAAVLRPKAKEVRTGLNLASAQIYHQKCATSDPPRALTRIARFPGGWVLSSNIWWAAPTSFNGKTAAKHASTTPDSIMRFSSRHCSRLAK
jgi:hypothetical protein